MLIINEKTSLKFRAEFMDEENNPIPSENLTHAVYSLYDTTNKEYIIEKTDIKPLITNGVAIIDITRQQNTLQKPENNKQEYRRLKVDYSYNLGEKGKPILYKYIIEKV